MRFAIALVACITVGCGGEIASDELSAPPVATVVQATGEVTGSVTLYSGSWPREATPRPFSTRVVLARPIVINDGSWPREKDLEIVARAASDASGKFALSAPPGRYSIFAVYGDTFSDSLPGEASPVNDVVVVQKGNLVERNVFLYAYRD